MRRKNTQTIGEVLHEYVDAMSMRKRLKESRIEKIWEEILGKHSASLTRKVYIKQGVLFAHLKSSVLRNELLMMREKIIARVNEAAGETIVNKIILK
jgi:predicted nucleic acid-binding Zn ribbon protein